MAGMIEKLIFRMYQTVGKTFLTPMLFLEWKRNLFFKEINERVLEFGYACNWLSKLCPAEVLDVGSGISSWPHLMRNSGFHVTAIDKMEGYWKGDFLNRHYYIINDDITQPKMKQQFDFITCISVLEHIPEHNEAMKGMFSLLKPGGYLVLTFPFNANHYVENAYTLPNSSYGKEETYICQIYSQKEIDRWLKENNGTIIDQEYYQIFTGDLWTEGKRIYPPRKVSKREKHHLTCILMQKST
jgi:2-polyprenyl-3-methyl-5-hydroxy-6-metoxy-1,4-benzoquinol methylase